MEEEVKNVYMVMDGQWGSTGKGLIAGYLARRHGPDGVVCNFGPNAGHTFVYEGRRVMTRQLPTGIVSPDTRFIFIGPGAIIDPDVLDKELLEFEDLLRGKLILVHERAAVTNAGHREQEREALCHISSTAKGTGAAMTAKTMRREDTIARSYKGSQHKWTQHVVSHDTYMSMLVRMASLQIESAQGFELGINSGSHYPYCTGRDITPTQIMADCGVPHTYARFMRVVVSLRTFPIRVGDQYNAVGVKIGTSGPVYGDQQEVSFAAIGVPDEHTTVTGKKRRVFTFGDISTRRMIESVRPDYIFLNFTNYVSATPSFDDPSVQRYVKRIHDAYESVIGRRPWDDLVRYLGTGPDEKDVLEWGRP